jgi:hypothetical protein
MLLLLLYCCFPAAFLLIRYECRSDKMHALSHVIHRKAPTSEKLTALVAGHSGVELLSLLAAVVLLACRRCVFCVVWLQCVFCVFWLPCVFCGRSGRATSESALCPMLAGLLLLVCPLLLLLVCPLLLLLVCPLLAAPSRCLCLQRCSY